MEKKVKKPNIIYILGDDHRAEIMRCAGHPIIETPNLDKLASEGIMFKNAFCTSPVCTPSRSCHYLGQWERKHGVNFNSKTAISEDAWQKSLPILLKEQGYFTGWVGKNHVPVGHGGYKSGYMESTFDYWYGNHDHSHFYVKEYKGGEIYSNAKADTQVEVFEEGAMNFLNPQKEFIESCSRPLSYRDTDKPFCLFITFNLPHACGTGGMQMRPTDDELYITKYRDRFNDFQLPMTYISFEKTTIPKIPKEVYNGVQLPSYDYVRSPVALRERLVRICQTVTGMDRMIGNLRNKLEELGEAENTIIVFSTDHGIHHGEHGLGGKNLLYEEDLRIPMMIYDPRLPKQLQGQIREELVLVPDLAPTVLDLLEVEIPDTMQGASMYPLIHNQKQSWREEFFAEVQMDIQNYPRSECLRNNEWKYIRYFKRTEDPEQENVKFKSTLDDYNTCLWSTLYGDEEPIYEELYNLKNDIHEEYNLANNSKYSEVINEMREKLMIQGKRLKVDTKDPKTVSTAFL
jgi:arylsulfatase A-like enzyme